jgi:Heterokaryon incompatibility protein (HET)
VTACIRSPFLLLQALTSTVQDIEHLQNHKIHSIDPSTSSEITLELAKSWLTQCREKHLSCKLLAERMKFLPARLIDTEPLLGSEWRLWINAELSQDPSQPTSYMTLSHRWGTASSISSEGPYIEILEASNIEILKAGCPLSTLPKTFRDAVEIARSLRQRFLWIDSLCILQDSTEDWQEQSAAMRDIYTHSACNIAATGAVDSHGGCFFERKVSDILPCRFPEDSQGVSCDDCTIVSMDIWTDDIERASLNQRGWVLQERLLAPRTLHFAAQQIFWECNEMNACEIYPKELPSIYFLHRQPSLRCHHPLLPANAGKPDSDSGQEPSSTQDPYLFWSRIVGAYSRCGLTKPADKLAALSGLASQLQQVTKDDYYAGLWSKDLAGQLLWNVVGCTQADGSPSLRPLLYRAPTWSWASVDGVIKTNDVPFNIESFSKPLIQIVDIKTVPSTTDITGQIEHAYLLIKGVLTKASIERGPGNATTLSIGNLDNEVIFHLDTKLEESLSNISCVPIGHYSWSGLKDSPSIEGLIIQKKAADTSYIRLGTFKVESRIECEELGLEFWHEDPLGSYPSAANQQLITIL